ncbi:MAG: hypothetical protein V3V74_07650 [Nitrosomonadaceae bacterium]
MSNEAIDILNDELTRIRSQLLKLQAEEKEAVRLLKRLKDVANERVLAEELDEKFDNGEDVMGYFDLSKAKRPNEKL